MVKNIKLISFLFMLCINGYANLSDPFYNTNNEPTLFPGHSPGGWANRSAFAALKEDGSVVTWGDPFYGGDSSRVSHELQSGVKAIYSTIYSFAALKEDGSVVTWGDSDQGGDSSKVFDKLKSGVKSIYSTASAFAALKEDGSVVT